MIEVNNVYNIDCLEGMKELEDGSVNLVVVSPPYNVNLGNNKFKKDKYDIYNDNKDYGEYLNWLEKIFRLMYEKLAIGGRVCLSGETLISTKNGFVEIKDLKVGEEVLTHKGVWKKIIKKSKVLKEKSLILKVENSNSINITGDHKILSAKTDFCPYRDNYICRKNCPHLENVWRKNNTKKKCDKLFFKDYKYDFQEASSLNVGDLCLMPVPKYFKGEKKLKNNLAFLYGIYLSEGWCSYRKNKNFPDRFHFAFNLKEEQLHDEIKKVVFEEFCIKNNKDYIREGCKSINFSNKELAIFLSKNFGRGAGKKHIPDNIYNTYDKESLLKIVISFWFGDGSIVKTGKYGNLITLTTISKLLAMQIRDILYINNYSPRISNYNCSSGFTIDLYGKEALDFYEKSKNFYNIDEYNRDFIIEGKQKTYRKTFDEFISYKIKKKEEILNISNYFYDIEIEEDNSFCLSNFCVHNCINIGDLKNGSVPLSSDVIQFMKKIGYLTFSHIVWDKKQCGNRCSWGSWLSPSSPSFPTSFEHILIFSKETKKLQHKGISDLTKQEFIDWSLALWTFPGETGMKKFQHPSVFPEELPKRLIKMLTYKNDIVVDLFGGVGTTAVACKRLERNYIIFEISKKYCDTAIERLNNI